MLSIPLLLIFLLLTGCQGDSRQSAAPPSETDRIAEASGAPHDGPALVAFGDSLTEGFGVDPRQSYPALLEKELHRRGFDIRVINEGVSGDTTAGGLARVDSVLSHDPEYVLLALGANDGLRGQPVETMRENLRRMIERLRSGGAAVILAGMKAPPNMGASYTGRFQAVYPALAEEFDVPFLPFLLEGVAAEPDLNQPDGLHPNEAGNERVARLVADFLAPILEQDAQ